MSRTLKCTVPKSFDEKKLSVFMRGYVKMSYSLYATLRHIEGSVLREGVPIRSIDKVYEGDVITINLPDMERVLQTVQREVF